MNFMKLIYAVCGSYCTHKNSLEQLEKLALLGYSITAVFSENAAATSTRFGSCEETRNKVLQYCEGGIIGNIRECEEAVTKGGYDAMIVSPCTGNTLSKIASAGTDGVVPMAVKATLRNRKPVLIAIATNDGLSGSLANIAKTIERKNIFYVPFGQDDPVGKPASLVCDFEKLVPALHEAVRGNQLQPVLV